MLIAERAVDSSTVGIFAELLRAPPAVTGPLLRFAPSFADSRPSKGTRIIIKRKI